MLASSSIPEHSVSFADMLPAHIGKAVAVLLSVGLLLMTAPAEAQLPEWLAVEQLAPIESSEHPSNGRETFRNTSHLQSQNASTTLTTKIANLLMKAGASLTGVTSSSSSVADVGGDGNLDLLITGNDEDNQTATLYLGDGNGVFTEAGAGLMGVATGSSTIADVDGDGNLDILITGGNENNQFTATLYVGDGTGVFSEAGAGLTGVQISSTSIADVDGNGNLDLLITGLSENGPAASVYLGDGNGGFSEAGAGLTGVSSSSTSIADVDRDGNEDLIITGSDPNGNPTSTLYLGDGNGGFSQADAGLTGVEFGSSSIADVNGDGNLDLLITGLSENGPSASLYLGNGNGSFSKVVADLTGVYRSSSSVADVNADENEDLLITGNDGSNQTATLYLGNDSGGFSRTGAGLTGVEFGSSSIADMNGDGYPDFLITGTDENFESSTTLYLGDGTGGFKEAGQD